MNNLSDKMQSDTRPAGAGLGERLQAARIQQGLSADDIAGRMHLNVKIVKAIEDNDFDEFSAPIFVKGYLRAYARIVSLDEAEIIQQYASYYSHEDPPITTTSHLAPELSVADMRIKWTTYLVILGLAALLAAWWWNKNHDEPTPISLGGQQGNESAVQLDTNRGDDVLEDRQSGSSETATAPVAAVEPAVQPQAAGTEAQAPQPVIPQAAEPVAVEPLVPPPVAPQPAAPAAPQPEAVAESAAADAAADSTGEAAPAEAEPAAASTAESEPAPIRLGAPLLVAPSGSDTLTVEIDADTWADIKDGNGFQMVYHLLRAGQSLELTGSAPFTVFLGNGHGVEIRFNGEPIEFSQRIRSDNTTRLKIGG